MADSNEFHIAIAGAGVGGLAAAIGLVHMLPSNIKITIFEKATELKAIGASIGLGPNGMRSLYKLGVDPALIESVAFRQPSGHPFVYLHWKTGEILKQTSYKSVTERQDTMARFHRAHLQQILLESLPERATLHLSKGVASVQVQSDRVRLAFTDGTTFDADMLVGADGIHSAVRKTLVPDHTLRWTGGITLRSTFDASLVEDVAGLPQDAVFYFGHDNSVFASRLGKNQYTVVASADGDPDDPENIFNSDQWNTEGDLTVVRNMYKGWNPTVEALLKAVPYTRIYPNHLGTPLQSMAFDGRIALIGDAGHTHGGAFAAGGSLAINDAHALALALRYVWPAGSQTKPNGDQLARALSLFDKTRRPHVNKLIDVVETYVAAAHDKLRAPRKVETDAEFRARISGLGDTAWLAEHDVEDTFSLVIRAEEAKL